MFSLWVARLGKLGDAGCGVLVVAVLSLPLVLVTLASLPAVAVLPLLRGDGSKARRIVEQLTSWTEVLVSRGR
ncbi:hypothetical protein [Streptomyces sp. NPDC006879]|uniref:hypothetical protein n=1 Tax=Streptomyces sp. NPDC006879 TaxID=3364767 RepID=UPI003695EAEB